MEGQLRKHQPGGWGKRGEGGAAEEEEGGGGDGGAAEETPARWVG